MLLDTSDRRALEAIAKREDFTKRVPPLVAGGDLVLAVVMYFVLEPPVNLWVAIGLVCMGVLAAIFLGRALGRGAGSARSVLDGRNPTRTLTATVVGDVGDAPYPWTLESDSSDPREKFVHIDRGDVDWDLSAGQRYQVSFFGEDHRPLRSVVLIVPEGGMTRRWQYSAVVSAAKRYVRTS